MGKDPEVIEREIAETRERVGECVEAIGYKIDVKGRLGDRIDGARSTIAEKVGQVVAGASQRVPSQDELLRQPRRMARFVRQRPAGRVMAIAAGATALGLIAGLVFLRSRQTRQRRLLSVAENARERAGDASRRMVDRSRQVAQAVRDRVPSRN